MTRFNRESQALVRRVGAAALASFVAACMSGHQVVSDRKARVAWAGDDDANANDIFLRDPWEMWQTPHGKARYHRGTFMLLPDEIGPFKVGDISIYAKDGSDVRLDYQSIGFSNDSQSSETVSIFVSRSVGTVEEEWAGVVDRLRREHPGGEEADAFPVPMHYPASTKQAAFIVKRSDHFFQVSLFRNAGWTVRYQIECQREDIPFARSKTLSFLRDVRYVTEAAQ